MKSVHQGFALPLVIIIIAVSGIGGSVYYSQKIKAKNEAKKDTVLEQPEAGQIANRTKNESEDPPSVEVKNSISADTQISNPISGAVKINMTLQELLAYNKGKNMICNNNFTTSEGGTVSSTTYIGGGMLRGDSVVTYNGQTTKSSMIMKNGIFYSWKGNQGTKMSISASFDLNTVLNMGTYSKPKQGTEYSCIPWVPEANKFAVPASVQFIDYGSITFPSVSPEMMQKMMEGNVGY